MRGASLRKSSPGLHSSSLGIHFLSFILHPSSFILRFPMRYGLIAGNGRFPFMVVEGARRAGVSLSVAAIREETDPRIEQEVEHLTWVGIGQLGKMIRFFKNEGVDKAI